jgi:tRNA 2-thiouridine synthesizing protein A
MKARRRLAGLTPGTRLWLETTDPLAVIDIPAFCLDDSHRLVASEAVEGGHRFLVERG